MIEVKALVTGSIWMHSVGVGQEVTEGQDITLLECMKCEIPVQSPCDGEVEWLQAQGTVVEAGDVIAIIKEK